MERDLPFSSKLYAPPGYFDARHRTDGVDRRGGHVRPEYSEGGREGAFNLGPVDQAGQAYQWMAHADQFIEPGDG